MQKGGEREREKRRYYILIITHAVFNKCIKILKKMNILTQLFSNIINLKTQFILLIVCFKVLHKV